MKIMPIINLKNIEEKEILPGFKGRFVHSENLTIAYWEVKAGSILPEHSHVHEQISEVTKGKLEFTIENERFILKEGEVSVIPSNRVHSGKAITDCKIVDTFYPKRADYL